MTKNTRKTSRRRAVYGKQRMVQTRLPSPFNRLSSDSTSIRGRGLLTISSGASSTKGSMFLTPTALGGAPSLTWLVPALGSLANSYEFYIVNSMNIKLIPTVPLTNGALTAVGFEPSYDGVEIPDPASLNEVMMSKNHVATNQTEEKEFSLQPINYRNDWCVTSLVGPSQDKYNGYLQWMSSYVPGAGVAVAYLDISFVVTFAGLHI